MRVSELLAKHPELDVEFSTKQDDFFALDAIFIFRGIYPDDEPGDTSILLKTSEHTDTFVSDGLLTAARDIRQAKWNRKFMREES